MGNMVIFGVAILAFCMLAGILIGQLLGVVLGLDVNVGGIGIAMIILVVLIDYLIFSGIGLMGGGMLRDFAIVATAFGADFRELKKAGLAATDTRLVPYGAMTATFYTGLGCLLGPSILFIATKAIFG
jgi:hypothetical protein